MRIVALTGSETKQGWTLNDLHRAAKVLGIEFDTARWRELNAWIPLPFREGMGEDGAGCSSGVNVNEEGQCDPGARPSPNPSLRGRECQEVIYAGDVCLNDADALLLRTVGHGSLEQIVFRMDIVHRLAAGGKPVVNPPLAIEIAVDKYRSLSRLKAAGLKVSPTFVCQSPAEALIAFDRLGGDVVVKPLFGAEGVGIERITDICVARKLFETLTESESVFYLQQFINHDGRDLRLFVVGDRVIASMWRESDGWRTNMSRGGRGAIADPSDELCEIALRAARACETLVAGIDVVFDADGRSYILEVNASPGWKHLSRVTGVDVSREVLSFAVSRVAGEVCHAQPR